MVKRSAKIEPGRAALLGFLLFLNTETRIAGTTSSNLSKQTKSSSPVTSAASGIIQPLAVRKAGARYQLIAGERRWRFRPIRLGLAA